MRITITPKMQYLLQAGSQALYGCHTRAQAHAFSLGWWRGAGLQADQALTYANDTILEARYLYYVEHGHPPPDDEDSDKPLPPPDTSLPDPGTPQQMPSGDVIWI